MRVVNALIFLFALLFVSLGVIIYNTPGLYRPYDYETCMEMLHPTHRAGVNPCTSLK